MTISEFELLSSGEARALIAKYIETDPVIFALKAKSNILASSLIATQLKYLQRAKNKIPAYYNAQCIIPSLSFEQSSSEITSSMKDNKGKRCLDLTCGLGVDTLQFSKNFDSVITLEISHVLATIAQYNFSLLGAENIIVLNQLAEEFIKTYNGEPFDLIFVDPARRDNTNERVFLFEDCSPNIFEILPLLYKIGKKLIIKASPMFDNTEAWNIFPQMSKLITMSVNGECKELLLEFDFENSILNKKEEVIACRKGKEYRYIFDLYDKCEFKNTKSKKYLLEPDVVFYKSRTVQALLNKIDKEELMGQNSPDGYVFSEIPINDFPGRIFKILYVYDYSIKGLKKILKTNGIIKANIAKRNFPISVESIRKDLALKDGGDIYLFFTRNYNGDLVMYLTERFIN
jgi:hypothetical protein